MCLTLCASNSIGISSVASFTCAVATVISWAAVRIQSTITWVFAFFITTSQRVRAIRISQALIWPTLLIRVALVVFRTIAVGPVIFGLAVCILTTLLKEARILAFSTDACFVIRTFKVTLATS